MAKTAQPMQIKVTSFDVMTNDTPGKCKMDNENMYETNRSVGGCGSTMPSGGKGGEKNSWGRDLGALSALKQG